MNDYSKYGYELIGTNWVHPTAIIGDDVKMGDGNVIGPLCVIGQFGESSTRETRGGVRIGDNNIIHGCTAIDSGLHKNTVIRNGCFIMKGCYIAHDCFIEDKVTISAGVSIAGGVQIMEGANIGMNASIHQKVLVGPYVMIGMGSTIVKDKPIKPFRKYIRDSQLIGDNDKGRNKVSEGEAAELCAMYDAYLDIL